MNRAHSQDGDTDGGHSDAPDAGQAAHRTEPAAHRVVCHLDLLLEARGMTLASLAEQAGITAVNLSVLKNNRARAIRFSTLTAICRVLGCTVGELLEVTDDGGDEVPQGG